MTSQARRVWFITGASSGFGREIAAAALAAGGRVVATARRPEAIDLGTSDDLKVLRLDVTDRAQVDGTVAAAAATFGRLDVVVNNAGYGLLGALEEASEAQLRRIFETNVFGALNVTRASLPYLRQQRSGHLIQMSSVGGQIGTAGFSLYQATKFALEGFSEALADELLPLGIKVTIVEPGDFRTDFLARSIEMADPIDDYADSVGAIRKKPAELFGREPGDPALAAAAIIQVVDSQDPPMRLVLGADALERIHAKIDRQLAELDRWQRVTESTAFP